jgi:uncharacterized protein YecE (DUF72 family)
LGRLRIGCSGWQYAHWRGGFYPHELPTARWFAHYAITFDTVEINSSFYRLPPAETFAKWRDQAPERFIYAVKSSRYLTHMKKLKDPDNPLRRFFSRARHLGRHLGPILYQLPPRWPLNLERFEAFLGALKRLALRHRVRGPHVIEFRDTSWYDERVFALMEQHKVALCLHDMQECATERLVIGPCIYVRYHFGTRKYGGGYDTRRLEGWADWLAERILGGMNVYAYFNNDSGGHAPRDAVRLRSLMHARLGSAGADTGNQRLPRAI